VLIATVFLTIIGMSVGLVMGARAKDRADPVGQSTGPVAGPTATYRPACRTETQEAARGYGSSGTLVLVLKIETATSGVWICTDDAARLYYHANRGGADAVWIEGKTALFLTDVVAQDDGYRATSTDSQGRITTFDVSRDRLLITHKDGHVEEQPAI
jgi:hypothetical protein